MPRYRMGGSKTYQSTGMRKLSPNSKAYKEAYKRNQLTGNPDIYQCSGKWVDRG